MEYSQINAEEQRRAFFNAKLQGLEQQHLAETLEAEYAQASGAEPDESRTERIGTLEKQIEFVRKNMPAAHAAPAQQQGQ